MLPERLKSILLALAASLPISCSHPPPEPLEDPDPPAGARKAMFDDIEILDRHKVLRGQVSDLEGGNVRVRHGESPAIVDVKMAFAAIEEYREIKSSGLTEGDAQYYFYLNRASEKFHGAVKRASQAAGCDLVFEKDSIQIKPGIEGVYIPNLTRAVIAELKLK